MKSVEIKGLSKDIKGFNILNSIDLSLESGKIYGFYGRNGSGKTMLFRAICGLIVPSKGSIKVYGKELHKEISFPESVGVLIESPGFWNHYTGFDNLKILSRIKNKISDCDIKNAITSVGLDPEDKRVYKKYSLGMKQKLGLAQAIMEKPDLIVLDEPTNALDEESVKSFRKLLLKEKDRGATILIASHNNEDLDLICDEKFRVFDGKLEKNELKNIEGL